MPTDNVPLPASTGKAATREIVYSGELAQAQAVGLVTFEGPDDAKTATDVTYSYPLPTQEVSSPISLLNRILQVLMSPLGFDRSISRQRSTAVIESGTVTTVTTVTTVATVTTCATVSSLANIAAIGGYSAQMQIMDTNRAAWADCVRARIT
ncbi:hypothetical protein UFOVP703_60 [uncultured Caudovirales phage]|jgi:hypothetical protein|uniref:Uncharacterized protein n=1 Tax=uncultured Caudovirales phage TaxID=2100421 RepID=A0A6J5NN09_9CAUD|nr:hypothetical protein UFOVP703_60 [uncultured Caudovirales phage]